MRVRRLLFSPFRSFPRCFPSRHGKTPFFLVSLLLCLVLPSTLASSASGKEGRQWAVQLHDPTTYEYFTPKQAETYARARGFHSLGQIGQLPGYFLFEAIDCETLDVRSPLFADHCAKPGLKRRTPEVVHQEMMEADNVKWFEHQVAKKRAKRQLDFRQFPDPLFPRQWHLHNDGSAGGLANQDINVTPVWARGINGNGTTVSVIDDGVLFTHEDLSENWYEAGSYDFNERTTKPLPHNDADDHGTRCAGEIAAAVNNVCGVGVAPGVRLAAERLIADSATDAMEAQALNYHFHDIDIYSSSWGPDDDGASLDGPGYLAIAAMEAGVTDGRNGLGNIFVFASGNGGQEGDNCNFDSFANSIHTVSIGAISNTGQMPSYGELCSAHLAVTYSGGNGVGIVTSDVGEGGTKCTDAHSGTSAAAPLASGMIALMLSVRPNLGWRDVQQLIIATAKKNDPDDSAWRTNGAGFHISDKYGFGAMDATLLVEAAETHTLLPSPAIQVRKSSNNAVKIVAKEQPAEGAISTMQITDDEAGGLSSVEHVQAYVRIRHPQRKYLRIRLTSPAGTESVLATPRAKDTSLEGFNPWTFMTVQNWGESCIGTWTLTIDDVRSGEKDPVANAPYSSGELMGWSIAIHGTCGEEDVAIDPNQRKAGGRTCSHTVAAVRKQQQQRQKIIIGVLLVGVIGLTVCVFVFWWRTRGNRPGSAWTKLPENSSEDLGPMYNDIESPAKGRPNFDSLRSPVDIESPLPPPESATSYHFPKGTSSGLKRSVSIELLAVRSNRLEGGELSPQIAVDMPTDDSDDSGGEQAAARKQAQRVEAVRNNYLKRMNSPLGKSHTISGLSQNAAPTLSPAPLGSPASLRRQMNKTPPLDPQFSSSPLHSPAQSRKSMPKAPPPDFTPSTSAAQSAQPLSRSASTSNLLKKSASASMLKKYQD
ncbi:Proprotein convertase subtilisin/kexin type 7 [Geranomyces variabilis]|nr:Proprotein convertase subtilisin/kexin type 7 [Geranomyces variabilis]